MGNRLGYRVLGHLSFLAMLVFSLVWMFSRVCYTDSAYQLFDLINTGIFSINDGRRSMVVSELLPLLFIKLHLPLPSVIASYSLSFVLMAYACYIVVLHVLKDERTALVMPLFFLCMCHTFLHCISETFQLMFAAALLYALLAYRRQTASKAAAVAHALSLALVSVFCAFIHPVAIFFLAFVWLYVWVDESFRWRWETVFGLLVFVLAEVLKLALPAQGGRDASFLLPLPVLLSKLPDFLHFGSLHFFKNHIFSLYYLPLLLFVWMSVWYLRRRQWWKALFYIGFNLGFLFVTLWIYFAGDGPIAMERSFLPVMLFTALPFVREVMPAWKASWHKAVVCVLLPLLAISFIRMGVKAEKNSQRLQAMDAVMVKARQAGACKVFVSKEEAEALGIEFSWGTGVESMMYITSVRGKEQCSNLFVYDDAYLLDLPEMRAHNSMARFPWWVFYGLDMVNAAYFPLPEAPYHVLHLQDGRCRFDRVE